MVIPAPFAEPEVSPEPLFRVIFLSSTSNVAVFNVVVVPLTVRSPVTVKLLLNVALPVFDKCNATLVECPNSNLAGLSFALILKCALLSGLKVSVGFV